MFKTKNQIRAFSYLVVILSFALVGCMAKPSVTPQAQPTRDPNEERLLEQQLAGMNPAAVPVYQEATKAMDSGDAGKAAQLYKQVMMLAPGFSTSYRRLGYIELGLKHVDKAEELNRQAVALEPNSYNQSSLALVLVQKNTPKDSQDAFDLASSAVKSLPNDSQANLALLLSAATLNKLDVANQANQRLLELEPNNFVPHYFAGMLAANDGKWEKAEAELLLARDLGADPKFIQETLDKGISRNAFLLRSIRRGGIATGVWLIGFGILFVVGTLLSRVTIKALNETVPTPNAQIKPAENRIRSIYRVVIAVLSAYFYISIPFVILVLMLVVGGAFYLFLAIGTIPVQLAVVLVVMLVASLFAIVRSLFSRRKEIPPGREVSLIDVPELWKLVEDVARKLDARPVDVIYVTPFTGIAVYERGSILQKLRGAGKRHLILGMGVLPGLTQGQLAAILAHEYGHFSNRDTAGGNLAYLVYTSLTQIAEGLIRGGVALAFNPVWWFVMGYQRIFLRVTLGASRLQEVLADRYAAMAYGSQNFIDGLKSIIRESISFPLGADLEIRKSLELNRPISNLYVLPLDANLQGELQNKLDEAMNRQTSLYDSHPAPRERIGWIERMHIPYSSFQDNQQLSLYLFPNPEDLQRELTADLMKQVVKNR
jgi:Zn-dependent protease with chaperone function/tetratricopeptide (TPR) repeat protein